MLDKIQQGMDLDWVKDADGVRAKILTTLLNLDQKPLHTIQKLDFTKQIPKVVAVHADQNMPTLADGILFAFLNLAGFDIAVFTPTGYRDVDKFVNDDAYQEHQIGEFLFDLPVPDLTEYNKGLLGRLFGRK